jgi:dTMP kinase
MGLFITFEGGEGVGKTTQARLLIERLTGSGHSALGLREPGGTPLGDYLREWLKSTHEPLTAEAELYLFVAARAELVRTVIRPALDDGKVVVLDRYADSTTVYQGDARGLPAANVAAANELATSGLTPDLTLLLDSSPVEALARAGERQDPAGQQRFESEDGAFHQRVREGFLRLAKESPQRWAVLRAGQGIDDISEQVWERVAAVLTR